MKSDIIPKEVQFIIDRIKLMQRSGMVDPKKIESYVREHSKLLEHWVR